MYVYSALRSCLHMPTALCKHSLCITTCNKDRILKEHIEYLLKSPCYAKLLKSGLVEPEKNTARKKGENKNPWHLSHRHSNSIPLLEDTQGRPFTEIYHNNKPLAIAPSPSLVAPSDIVLSHSEKWMYLNPK